MCWSHNANFQVLLSLRFIIKNLLLPCTFAAGLHFPCFNISCWLLGAHSALHIHIRFVINNDTSRTSQFDHSSFHSMIKEENIPGMFEALLSSARNTHLQTWCSKLLSTHFFHVSTYTFISLWIFPRTHGFSTAVSTLVY